MQDILTALTHEEQAFVGPVSRTRKATTWASLAGMGGIDFHGHAAGEQGFVRKVAVQFSKGPLRVDTVALTLLPRNALGALPVWLTLVGTPLGAFADVCQVFQADDALWVRVHDAMTDEMIAILFQPSLSSTDDDQSSRGGTSALFLQPFSQSGIVIGCGAYSLTGIEMAVVFRIGRDRQVPLSDIDTDHVGMILWAWITNCYFQGDEQVKLLVRFVIPELGSTDICSIGDSRTVFAVSGVGNNHPSRERQDADLCIFLQAVVAMVVVGNRRRDVLRWTIQTLVAFLRCACTACGRILPDFGPQGFVGGSHLAWDITSHLGRYLVDATYLIVAVSL